MKKVIVIVMLAGMLTKVETITYENGHVVERVYNKPSDTVPSDIRIVRLGRPHIIKASDVIEHREVELLNYWNPTC